MNDTSDGVTEYCLSVFQKRRMTKVQYINSGILLMSLLH